MADIDTSANPGKAQDTAADATAARDSGGTPPNIARAEAQAGDPYRPAGGDDYALSVEPEDTGEATLANLYLAVPLEHEGSGAAQHDGGLAPSEGALDGNGGAEALGSGQGGNGRGNGSLPEGGADVTQTSDDGLGDGGGLGDGDVPEARGLDASLSEFDLGGNGIAASDSGAGGGIGGGGGDDDGGAPIEDLLDIDGDENFVVENAAEGTPVGVVARAVDPDGDTVTYEIIGGSPFVIDPFTGVISVGPDAEIDREVSESIDVTVRATSSDGSSVTETFTVQIGDDNTEFTIGPVTDTDLDDNFVSENATGGTVVELTALAEDPDATDEVTYEILNEDSPFEIDPVEGVVTVREGAVIDREETPFIDVTIQATSTDGSTSSQTFRVRVGDENEFPIGPVEDSDTDGNFVNENAAPGTEVGVTALAKDPDATDTVTYEIIDENSPFVIDPNTGVITVGPNADIDREQTEFFDVTVRATSSDGSFDEETFTVEVRDVDEFDVGPVTDIDERNDGLNSVAENGSGGEEVGITAFAEDLDATDEVTYSTTDPRFDIDPTSGVLTVREGVSFDYETTKSVDVEITATSTDGSSSTGTFTVNILDVNEAPDLDFDPELGAGVSVTMTFVEENAGYSNTMGVFYRDAEGNPVGGEIVWVDQNVLSAGDTKTIHIEGVDAADVGYFLIPDGDDLNTGLASGDKVTFRQDGSGNWQAVAEDGTPLTGQGANILFSGDGALNPDGFDQTDEFGFVVSFEDIKGGGDRDFNDVVFAQNTFETDAQAAVYEEEFGAVVGELTVTDPDEVDTQTFQVSDDRFEVVADGGKFVLKLKDDQKLDYETETQVPVEVTVFDKGDLTDTETIVIDVIDVIENTSPIGPLSDSNTVDNAVDENANVGAGTGVTAFARDPDAGDQVVYKIVDQDTPFTIDPQSGVITVKEGAVIDREATPFIDVTVQAISTDGSSNTGVFRIDVTDDTSDFSIGPIEDRDQAANSISELVDKGDPVNITAFAEDKDATDTVSYELTDDSNGRFEIDETSGVITVADSASFDAETEPEVTVTVKATSTDGSFETKDFTIDVSDGNEPPDLIVHLDNASNELIINGSFEDFEATSFSGREGSGWYQDPDSVEGWDYQYIDIHQAGAGGNLGATDGAHHMDLSGDRNGMASQTVDGMLDGQVYNLSFDLKSRGDIGQSVTEVYWNGDLIDTIDPKETGSDWQTYSFEIAGGAGDKTDTLKFVEVGTPNSYGTVIDSVSIKSDGRIAILEEFEGAEVAPLSVIDPDVGDTHTFTVSDARFEVVESGGKYLLKLKDDQALDYETETEVTVQVTVTDSGGLSDTETVIIDVIDVDENTAPIGPLSDDDQTRNSVVENAAVGTVVGVTALAVDPDPADSVTYEIIDQTSPFVIGPQSGVITVKDGAVIDREATDSIDVTVKATSSDGSSTTEVFEVEVRDDVTEFAIGPIEDTDQKANTISELSGNGDPANITAFAEDQDATDTVSYELSDDSNGRFEINETTGVITVANGASFDAESEPEVTVTVKATSTDGSFETKDFTIEVADGNEAPDLIVHLEDGSKQFIVNGSFEVFEGKLGGRDGSGWYQDPVSIEGWSYQDVDVHQAGHLNFGATDGDHHLDLASVTNGQASQQIEGQLDGQVYELQFDMKSRGGVGQSVAEVYWNGELIDTIDPATTGSDWQTYNFDIVGGSGDGSNTLTFVEIGSDNNGGALIDSVSIVSDSRTAVLEEFAGAEIAPLSVIDPDVGDTHTFSVSDDRFEVVVSGDKYLLKLEDDQALDYEQETQVSLEVTATDEGGLSDTEVIVIDVIDIDDTDVPVTANDDVASVGLPKTAFYYTDNDGEVHLISSDGSDIVLGKTGVGWLTDIAVDAEGDLYGISFDHFYSVDKQTGAATKISTDEIGRGLNALEFGPDGTLYAADGGGVLYTVDPGTGETSKVGQMDYRSAGDLTFVGSKLYLSAGGGSIVEINPATGATVALVATLPVSNAYGLVADDSGQLLALTNGGIVYQVDPSTGTVSVSDEYDINDGAWGATGSGEAVGLPQTIDGNVLANDADPEGSMQVTSVSFDGQDYAAGASIQGDYGMLVVNSDGSYTYTADPDSAAAQSLSQGTSGEDVFTYTVTDGAGNTDTAMLEVTIDGYDDILVGGSGDDNLSGNGGNDILVGNGGADTLLGGAGNDVLRGGEGNDTMNGGDGSDLFAYMLGDGDDVITGGGGVNWIDMIDLANAEDGTSIGTYGTDWSVTTTEGTIENVDAVNGEITLSQDAGGYIELADGGRIDFAELEGIQY